MTEEWKWVVGYEGRYRVSNKGQIMTVGSIHVNPDGRLRAHKPKIPRL